MKIDKYFKGDEEALPSILEAILQRKLGGKLEDTDDELVEELRMQPLDDVKDKEFESDFEELYETDEEIDDLYSARDIVMKKMVKDEYFNMDDKKWDELVEDGIKHGILKDTKECEQILEDMLSWDKLLPDDMKKKVEAKFNELGDLCEKGELEPEEAYNQFKEFEDQMKAPPKFDETDVADNKKDLDDPPGEGPILWWQTRVVFEPGLNTEENRKDCLGTLFSLIEEAGKANKLVEDARTSYVKERLRANPQSMERLPCTTYEFLVCCCCEPSEGSCLDASDRAAAAAA
ncbi:hypothetical protein SDJN02_15354, partial [Cucurbita argyrosperma subsp. argyrosperma]